VHTARAFVSGAAWVVLVLEQAVFELQALVLQHSPRVFLLCHLWDLVLLAQVVCIRGLAHSRVVHA